MQSPIPAGTSIARRLNAEQTGIALLLVAGVVVAIAIATEGALSRAVNGIAGVLWILSAWFLVNALRSDLKFWPRLAQVTAICLVLVLVVRPGDLALALSGFSAAGAIVAATTGTRGFTWAVLLPALWLPVHLGTAVAKAAYRAIADQPAALRSDPPPTAAIVPFSMIVGAMIGAWLVRRYMLNRRERQTSAGA
jgi:hypothetical protein